MRGRDRNRLLLSVICLLAAAVVVLRVWPRAFEGGGEILPWETWRDLHALAELHRGHQTLLRSSHCPDGCRYDRQSDGDWRYLWVDGDEGVIFEETGAGAITRIWMTMGQGVSVPLDPEVRLRIYLDGATTPVVDLPLPALFDGSTPPFVPPIVGHRLISSGGNFSYVPIPYRDGCRVTLVGAHDQRIWYQINFHRLADADGIETFTGNEDLTALADLLTFQGLDPWPSSSGTTTTGTASLAPHEEQSLVAHQGQGSLTALKLRLDPALWPEVELLLTFDGEPSVRMALRDFFAFGRGGPLPTRSLLLGLDEEGFLYCYFPMPFFESAEVTLIHNGSVAASVEYELRLDTAAPSARSGLFGAVLSEDPATATGVDFPMISISGEGKLAGTFLELGATTGVGRDYLEGDERLFIDRSPHPAVYGTGVEDYCNGGFYFDQGPFSLALSGAPYTELEDDSGLPTTAAYRLMLTDGITFANHLYAGLEGGPTGDVSMRARAVSYFYRRRPARLYLADRLDLGSAVDREGHLYQVAGPHAFQELTAFFEGEPPASDTATGVYRPPGAATFVLRSGQISTRYRLRRRLDAGIAGQRATVLVGGEPVGSFPPIDVNQARRWREIDIDLASQVEPAEELTITVVAEPGPGAGTASQFSAFRYELWTNLPAGLFADAFESGDISAWAEAAPSSAKTEIGP